MMEDVKLAFANKTMSFPILKIYVDLVVIIDIIAIMDKTVISEWGEIIKLYFVTYNTPVIDLILDT